MPNQALDSDTFVAIKGHHLFARIFSSFISKESPRFLSDRNSIISVLAIIFYSFFNRNYARLSSKISFVFSEFTFVNE
jgi:hypothetical protein